MRILAFLLLLPAIAWGQVAAPPESTDVLHVYRPTAGAITNPAAHGRYTIADVLGALDTSGFELIEDKDQYGGYLGIDAEGDVWVPNELTTYGLTVGELGISTEGPVTVGAIINAGDEHYWDVGNLYSVVGGGPAGRIAYDASKGTLEVSDGTATPTYPALVYPVVTTDDYPVSPALAARNPLVYFQSSGTLSLPAPASTALGATVCAVSDAATTTITIAPPQDASLRLVGAEALGVGTAYESSGAAGEMACFVRLGTEWVQRLPEIGTWAGGDAGGNWNPGLLTDSNVVGLWRMESGALGTDSASTNTLTASDGVTADTTNYREGAGSGSFDSSTYPGTLSRADADLTADFPGKSGGSGTFTFATWLRPVNPASTNVFVGKRDSSLSSNDVFSAYFSATTWYLQHISSGPVSDTDTLKIVHSVVDGTWYHVCISYDDSTKDGIMVLWNGTTEYTDTGTFGAALQIGNAPFQLGARAVGLTSYAYNGNMDESVMFKVALSAADCTKIRQGIY